MSRPISKHLTDHELRIMKFFWQTHQCSVRDVLEGLQMELKPAYTSLQTAINNLVKKGYLSKRKGGKEHQFSPMISQNAYQESVANDLIEDVYGGRAFDLAVNLIENKKMTEEEIQKIKELLDEM